MKKNVWRLALLLVLLVQLACEVEDVSPEYFCEAKGGKWHPSTIYESAYCESATPTPKPQTENQAGEMPIEPEGAQPVATEKYLTPTPASAQECNATIYIQTQIEIVKTVQETYYRDCDYKLSASNIHPTDGIWVVRRTNTSVHSAATNLDDSYWYSELIFPGQVWEQQFHSSYSTNGQFSRQGVDRVAGVFDRPECYYLLSSAEVEAISQPVEWMCGP
ncbi:MAG: hypothetical protein HZB50_17830 [Chloroflexi bacterium]|nr:hypothetical protein [Chloroflexota bacterium]